MRGTEGVCGRAGHSERGCTGLCDIRAVIGEDMYEEIGGEEMEAAFQRELEEERQQMVSGDFFVVCGFLFF